MSDIVADASILYMNYELLFPTSGKKCLFSFLFCFSFFYCPGIQIGFKHILAKNNNNSKTSHIHALYYIAYHKLICYFYCPHNNITMPYSTLKS